MINESHKRILALRAQGLTYAAISKELGIALGTVGGVCKGYAPLPGDQPVPEGMSLLTAREIERITGFWPCDRNAEQISRRAADILEDRRRKSTMLELGNWLRKLGLAP